MLTNFKRAHAELMALRCVACRGNGECDDSAPGDIAFNKCKCTTCKGTGFKDGKVPIFHAFRVEFVAEQCGLAYVSGRKDGYEEGLSKSSPEATFNDAKIGEAYWRNSTRIIQAAQLREHSLSLMTVTNELSNDPLAFVAILKHELQERGVLLIHLMGDTQPAKAG